jgi:UDP-N-acetylmuramoylalanine--D-glutamate ligase
MDVRGKRVLVVGLGKSGVASALFLQERGAKVAVSDAKSQEQLRGEIPLLLDHGINVETGQHGERTFRDQDLIVVSPGVPFDVPQLIHARELGIPVIGEVELAARFLKGHIVAITGSNGKTTTTTLTGEIISAGGRKALVGGNIGTPAITFVDRAKEDTWVVLEISSFQLETIETFHPQIAVVLNITPDHLDRHHTFENYAAAKARIFENQTAGDFAVLNADNEPCVALASKTRAQVRWFSRLKEVASGAFVRGEQIVWRDEHGDREILPLREIALKGAHNVENVLAAVCVGMIAGIEPAQIRHAVSDFSAVEHRLEYVATVGGVEYYNDSKATNVDATIKALESFHGRIDLFLGG